MLILEMRRFLPTAAVFASLAGCEVPPATTPTVIEPAQSLSPAAAALRDRLTNTENGLEIRRWIIANESNRMVTALVTHLEGQALDAPTLDRLRRNGLRFIRVPVDRLESLLADLGGATYDAHEWHGQVHEWRSILDRSVAAGGHAVAVDGMVRRYDRGDFRLMLRTWTLQMEHGPYVHLELLPRHAVNDRRDLRRLLGEDSERHLGFGSMAIDVLLDAGYAYLLIGAQPQTTWEGIDAPLMGEGDEPASAHTSGRGVEMDLGPDVATPLTLGEFLLAPETSATTRPVLIFVPKVADALYLPEQSAARSAQRPVGTKAGGG